MTGLKQNYDFKCLEGNEKKLFDKRGEPKHLFKFIQQYLKEDWDTPFPGTPPILFPIHFSNVFLKTVFSGFLILSFTIT